MPYNPFKVNQRFGGKCRLHLQDRRISRARNQRENRWQAALGLFFDSEMEATCSPKTSVDFQRATKRYMPEDRTLHNHRCENLKSYKGEEKGAEEAKITTKFTA
jgi:hypothetical protein